MAPILEDCQRVLARWRGHLKHRAPPYFEPKMISNLVCVTPKLFPAVPHLFVLICDSFPKASLMLGFPLFILFGFALAGDVGNVVEGRSRWERVREEVSTVCLCVRARVCVCVCVCACQPLFLRDTRLLYFHQQPQTKQGDSTSVGLRPTKLPVKWGPAWPAGRTRRLSEQKIAYCCTGIFRLFQAKSGKSWLLKKYLLRTLHFAFISMVSSSLASRHMEPLIHLSSVCGALSLLCHWDLSLQEMQEQG